MDIRELINKLNRIKMWTQQGSMARNLVDELINHFKSQLPPQ
jgi:hypothetical protein